MVNVYRSWKAIKAQINQDKGFDKLTSDQVKLWKWMTDLLDEDDDEDE